MPDSLLRAFRFRVKLRQSDGGGLTLGDGGFQECSGLEVEMDVQEYLEGGNNDGVIRRAGRDHRQQGGVALFLIHKRIGKRAANGAVFGADDQVNVCDFVSITDKGFADQ